MKTGSFSDDRKAVVAAFDRPACRSVCRRRRDGIAVSVDLRNFAKLELANARFDLFPITDYPGEVIGLDGVYGESQIMTGIVSFE